MRNIFKNKKQIIATILMFCILLSITETCAYVIAAEENTTVTNETVWELTPVMVARCTPTYVPGIGYTGTPEWYSAIELVQAGGHIQGWGSNNIFLSEANAKLLISAAGFQVYGEVESHDNCHNYPHIHYIVNGSRHNTIRLG